MRRAGLAAVLLAVAAPAASAPPPRLTAETAPIVFARYCEVATCRARSTLWIIPRVGATARRVTAEDVESDHPSWSPDRRSIAFTRGNHLFVMGANGRGLRQLTYGPNGDVEAAWSPDGHRIAFVREGDIWVIGADGRGLRPLTAGKTAPTADDTPPNDSSPTWSPDGKRILFDRVLYHEAGRTELFLVRATGGGLRRLTKDDVDQEEPSWSPRGDRIAFLRQEGSGAPRTIYTMRLDGSGLTRVTRRDLDSNPDWSPDGRKIVFVRPGRIAVVNADGSGRVKQVTKRESNVHVPDW